MTEPFAIAFVLSLKENKNSYGSIKVNTSTVAGEKSHCKNDSLNKLQASNPIAECLPLLEALCLKTPTTLYLPHLNNLNLKVEVSQ